MLQAAGDLAPLLNQAKEFTFTTALIFAVARLWVSRENALRQLVDTTKTTTQALVEASEAQKEMRKIVEESTHAKEALTEAIHALTASLGSLPCTVEEKKNNSRR